MTMPRELKISVGQHSDKGRKETNQDFHGVLIPDEPLLSLKGIAVVLADGISSSNVSQIASESAVKSFLTDYYCTSESWSVKTSAQRVMAATNSWLHAQTRRSQYAYDKDKGYVCTLSAMVIKSTTAHIFHIGDCRIYRVAGNTLEQLTEDHRVVVSSRAELSRPRARRKSADRDRLPDAADRERRHLPAGDRRRLRTCRRPLHRQGDRDTPTTSTARRRHRRGGLRERQHGQPHGPDRPHRRVAGRRGRRGVRAAASELPLPPLLEARMVFDGYRIVRELHASSRSHIYLAVDIETDTLVAHQDPVDRPARRPGLSEALHDGGMGRAAHRQPPRPEAVPAVAQAQLSSTS